jgi:hypothetical protein
VAEGDPSLRPRSRRTPALPRLKVPWRAARAPPCTTAASATTFVGKSAYVGVRLPYFVDIPAAHRASTDSSMSRVAPFIRSSARCVPVRGDR